MTLLTIMDFHDHTHVQMCKVWIYLAKRFNPNATIIIFYQRRNNEILRFAKRYNNMQFLELPKLPDLRIADVQGEVAQRCHVVKLTFWLAVEKYHINKFIYVDADAFILHSLASWWSVIDSKPFIAISERYVDGGTLYNGGVFSYSSDKGFMTFDHLKEQYIIDGNRITLPASEQGLMNAYFRRIRYQAQHPRITHAYNCFAKYCVVQEANDRNISVLSGRYTWQDRIKRRLMGVPTDWWEGWFRRKKRVPVYILHAFGGKGLRFWDLKECDILWKYCLTKI